MQSSDFSNNQLQFEGLEQVETHGATCDTYRVKLYGKMHFLKRLKAEYVDDIRYQEVFRKEFETGYPLEHPNLVRYVFLTDDGILMEYIDGETLTQRLSNHPDYFQKRKSVEKLVSQLLDVVGYLHSHQVLHLDLKPDNILLTRINDDVKLVDLGFSYTDAFPDNMGHTEGFAAPEQLSTVNDQLSISTDIYAIGKILELLPDHHIYNKVIARCTAETPADRYQSIEELKKAVAKRSIWKPLWLVLLALFIAGVVTYMLLSPNKEQQPVLPIAPADSSSVMPAVTPRTRHVVPDAPVVETPPTPQPVAPAAVEASPKQDDISRLRADIVKAVKPKYDATLGTLPDGVKVSKEQWGESGRAFLELLDEPVLLNSLIQAYPDIPEETVTGEYHNYVQSLITLKFNKTLQNQPE